MHKCCIPCLVMVRHLVFRTETVLLSTHRTCMITSEERLKGLQGTDILLVECKYCDTVFLSGGINIGFGCSKGRTH